jgi:hypothetical protein
MDGAGDTRLKSGAVLIMGGTPMPRPHENPPVSGQARGEIEQGRRLMVGVILPTGRD